MEADRLKPVLPKHISELFRTLHTKRRLKMDTVFVVLFIAEAKDSRQSPSLDRKVRYMFLIGHVSLRDM